MSPEAITPAGSSRTDIYGELAGLLSLIVGVAWAALADYVHGRKRDARHTIENRRRVNHSRASSLVLVNLLAVACGDHESQDTGSPRDPGAEHDLTTLRLDDLLDQLPPFLEDADWDSEAGKYVLVPAAAELKRRLDAGETMTDEQWRKALLRSRAIRVRSPWPVEQPYAVSMRSPWTWLGIARIEMVPRRAGLDSAAAGSLIADSFCGFGAMQEYQDALYQELGTIPLGRHSLVFDTTVERGSPDFDAPAAPPAGVVWQGQLKVDVEVVETVDEVIPPVRDPALDAAVRSSVCIAYGTWWIDEEYRRAAILAIHPDVDGFALLDSTALSLRVEVLEAGRVIETTQLVAHCYDAADLTNVDLEDPNAWIGFLVVESVPSSLEHDEDGLKDWSLRLTGTRKDLLPLWNAKRRWSGQVTVPFPEARARELERMGTDRGCWVSVFSD